jgi:hypothetical protein
VGAENLQRQLAVAVEALDRRLTPEGQQRAYQRAIHRWQASLDPNLASGGAPDPLGGQPILSNRLNLDPNGDRSPWVPEWLTRVYGKAQHFVQSNLVQPAVGFAQKWGWRVTAVYTTAKVAAFVARN